jgi:hypothetical protein
VIDELALFSLATAEFASRLRLVGADDWDRATPSNGWDVRALVNHVVDANRRHRMLLHGASAAAATATRTVDHLGADPKGCFATTAAELASSSPLIHRPRRDRNGHDRHDSDAYPIGFFIRSRPAAFAYVAVYGFVFTFQSDTLVVGGSAGRNRRSC